MVNKGSDAPAARARVRWLISRAERGVSAKEPAGCSGVE